MIQEKDFLYRVPVKTAPITTPRGQIRNPEILVDLEGGEFMHGNILDANSTNKLINQSVKDAVDDKFIENGYVTKGLLEAETSARTKGDEDLGAKIKAEQTRAEGKEKEISDKLAIVDGDSNTEGSFRKAIAEKADAAALSNYVLTTALNQQVDTLNTAISAKQDAGSYIPYNPKEGSVYQINKDLKIGSEGTEYTIISDQGFYGYSIAANYSFDNTGINIISDGAELIINCDSISSTYGNINYFSIDYNNITLGDTSAPKVKISSEGIKFANKSNKEIPTADGTFINLSSLASAEDISSLMVGLSKKQNRITVNDVDVTDIETADITKLRTIVTNLINALSASGLIRQIETLE